MNQVVSPFITHSESSDEPRPVVDSPTEIPVMTEQHLHAVAMLHFAISGFTAQRKASGQLQQLNQKFVKLEKQLEANRVPEWLTQSSHPDIEGLIRSVDSQFKTIKRMEDETRKQTGKRRARNNEMRILIEEIETTLRGALQIIQTLEQQDEETATWLQQVVRVGKRIDLMKQSLASPPQEPTHDDFDNLRHMLGLNQSAIAFRNYYCAASDALPSMNRLEVAGYVRRGKRVVNDYDEQFYFHATVAGCLAVGMTEENAKELAR